MLKVLVVDDDEHWHILFKTAIESVNSKIEIIFCNSKETALIVITTEREQLLAVFTDNYLEDDNVASGKDIANKAKQESVPNIVIITSRPSEIITPEGVSLWNKEDGINKDELKKILKKSQEIE